MLKKLLSITPFLSSDSPVLSGECILAESEDEILESCTVSAAPPQPREKLRDLCWSVGAFFPPSPRCSGIVLLAVDPDTACIQWHLDQEFVAARKAENGLPAGSTERMIIRISDVTDIDFDGCNAHRFSDFAVGNALSGIHYQPVRESGRNLLAEIGFLVEGWRFVACARSNTILFARPHRSGRCNPAGRYVDGELERMFAVENVTCSSVFDRMHRLIRERSLKSLPSTAIFITEQAVVPGPGEKLPVTGFVKGIVEKCESMALTTRMICPQLDGETFFAEDSPVQRAMKISQKAQSAFNALHAVRPFDCIQFHDWYSAPGAVQASLEWRLPLVCVLHSIEPERSGGSSENPLSKQIEAVERFAISAADYVLTPQESSRERIISHYAKAADKVAVVSDLLKTEGGSGAARYSAVGGGDGPMVLFADELSYGSGVDLLMNALPDVCREFNRGVFVFAGDGPMRGEMERRAREAGIAHRCRFLGDIPAHLFEELLSSCDMAVIPARHCQDRGFGGLALGRGKPVVATHQANVHGIVHGVNGLRIYDNPGSVSWGVKEMLGKIGSMPLYIATRHHSSQTVENTAAEYITFWMRAAADQGAHHA
jgi:glycosyltransferase involved in cell wall biosynthesis